MGPFVCRGLDMERSTGWLMQGILLQAARLFDCSALLMISQFRRKVERASEDATSPLIEQTLLTLRGVEWSLWVGILCPTRFVAYAALTLMAKDYVVSGLVFMLLSEAALWYLFPIGPAYLLLDLLMTLVLSHWLPSEQERSYRRAALGWPLVLESSHPAAPAAWFVLLMAIGSVSEIIYFLAWAQWMMFAVEELEEYEEETEDDEGFVEDTPSLVVEEYYSDVFGPATYVMVFLEMWWTGVQRLRRMNAH